MSITLPPVNKSSLPPLNGALMRTLKPLKTITTNKDDEKTSSNPLNMSQLPKITHSTDEGSKFSCSIALMTSWSCWCW